MAERRLKPVLATALVLTATLGAAPPAESRELKVAVGQPLPALSLKTRTGAAVEPAAGDDVHLLVFLRHERQFEQLAVEDVKAIAHRINDAHLIPRIVWVAQNEEPSESTLKLTGDPWFDPERHAVEALGLIVYPTTLVVSKDRHVAEIVVSHPPNYATLVESASRLALGLIDHAEYEGLRGEGKEPEHEADSHKQSRANLRATFGNRLSRAGQYDEAEAQFKIALEKDPQDPRTTQLYAEHLLRQGKADDAAPLVDAALRQDPNHPGLRLLSARVLVLHEKYDDAEKLLEELLLVHPDRPRVLIELARIQEKKNDFRRAAELYREAATTLLQRIDRMDDDG